ncbi:MAG: FlgD immunoglobulin-like domain containing protein, partial [bacterium]
KLSIYNMLGQKIKTLKNSFQNTGEYTFTWDSTDDENNPVSSGVYLYKLESDNLSSQKKMILLR